MKNSNSQRPPPKATPYNISLVKYQNPKPRDVFDLTTVHSLLIDQNDKFIKLKQLVMEYNTKQTHSKLNRPRFDRQFITQLYKMLCQLTVMCHYENQQDYLNKIYKWAFRLQTQQDEFQYDGCYDNNDNNQGKMRPTTASTRTRPYSANTRKSRPDSAVLNKQSIAASKPSQNDLPISQSIMSKYPQVDFKQLKHGQKQFYRGQRTFHPQLEKPKIRLKQYHRKVLYNEDEDQQNKFPQFFEEQQKIQTHFHKQILTKPKQLSKQELQLEILPEDKPLNEDIIKLDGQQPPQGINQGVQGMPQQDVNIDDLVGDQQGIPLEEQQEQQQVIDKLKPKIAPYQGQVKSMTRANAIKFYGRLQDEHNNRQQLTRKVIQEDKNSYMIKQWAKSKSKIKSEYQRRSEVGRLANPHPGIKYEDQKKQNLAIEAQQIIDLSNEKIYTTKASTKPQQQFNPSSKRVYNQTIKNSLITGKLQEHLKLIEHHGSTNIEQQKNDRVAYNNWIQDNRNERAVSVGVKPKKKTFQQILRDAQQQVAFDAANQVDNLKQKLASNKIALSGNRIQKSLTYHMAEVQDGDFVGEITGKHMLNNPFFKVAKKKKKKKKKK